MTKRELIELLDKVTDDFEVIISSDSEGNNYSPLANYDIAEYKKETPFSGYIIQEGEEDFVVNNCIVLFPLT